jgi:regulator of protease activity HflC (stomatin/prohibitin superfamily)
MTKGKIAMRIGAGALIAVLLFLSLVITPVGHRSVIWSVGGISYEEREPGLSFVFPLIQRSHQVDVREQRYVTVNSEGKNNAYVQSSDLQEITVRGTVVFNIEATQVAELWDATGANYQGIVQSVFVDAIKEASGKVKAEAFAGSLGALASEVEKIITPQLEGRGIQVRSVLLEDAVFDPEFVLSVKEKVIAEQEVAEQEKLVEAEAAKRLQVEIQAEAQRERATSLGLSPEQYLELLWLEKWGGVLPTTVLGGDEDLILNLP